MLALLSPLSGHASLDSLRLNPSGQAQRGEGNVLLCKYTLRIKQIAISSPRTTFKILSASVSSHLNPTTNGPGSVPLSTALYTEFANTMEQFVLFNTQIVVLDDLILYLEDSSLQSTLEFSSIPETVLPHPARAAPPVRTVASCTSSLSIHNQSI